MIALNGAPGPAGALRRSDRRPPAHRQLAQALQLDEGRRLGWAFAQAVLAAIRVVEHDGALTRGLGRIALATALHTIV